MSDRAARACILAVGTELTTGQIPNGNAAWLSERLTEMGLEIPLHETVPDDRPLIREALERCARLGRYLFITGGLGPTTDDFTREVVAEWHGKRLQFHEPSWKHIHDRLAGFGVPVVESQRQQCLYPEGAEVFTNQAGTANAFYVRHDADTHAWILPGPPREIAWLWDEGGVREHVRERAPRHEELRLLRWHCIGRSEAELGEAVERALAGTGVRTGYRFQRPYVEVKVWCPASRLAELAPAFARLETALGDSLIARDGADIVEEWLRGLSLATEIEIFDAATGGMLAERLGRWLRDPKFAETARALTLNTEWIMPDAPTEWVSGILAGLGGSPDRPGGDNSEALVLAVGGFTPAGEWAVGLRFGDRTRQATLQLPYRGATGGPEALERARRYAAEIAIRTWSQFLRQQIS